MNGKKTYKKPPIVERVICVHADIKPELFEAKVPEWAIRIRDTFPISRPISEWSLNIKEMNGVPVIENGMPKAEIIQLFWKRPPKGEPFCGMRLRPSRLGFHLLREGTDAHDFEEIYREMETWIDRWMDHFEVKSIKGITAEYFNQLNATITPQFMLPDGRLLLSKAFKLFADIPGKYQGITPPYNNRIRLIVDEARPCYFDLRVRSENTVHASVRIDFMVTTLDRNKALSAKEALAELHLGHDVLLEQFDCFFSEEAKNSFVPS